MKESLGLCLPPILLDRESSDESLSRNGYNNFSNASKVYSVMVHKGITNEYLGPDLSPKTGNLFLNLYSRSVVMMENRTLQFMVLDVSGKNLLQWDYQKMLSHLF